MSYPSSDKENEFVVTSGSSFDVKKFVFRLISFLPWIIISLLLCLLSAQVYLRYTPKMHKISAFVLIKDNEESSPDYKILKELGVMPGSKEVQNQIDILQSYSLIKEVVDTLNLQVQLYSEGRISSSALYGSQSPLHIYSEWKNNFPEKPASYNLRILNTRIGVKNEGKIKYYDYGDTVTLNNRNFYFLPNEEVKPAVEEYSLVVSDRNNVITGLRNALDVRKLHEMGGIIEVSMLDEIPQRGIDIINQLVKAYDQAGLEDKNIVSNKTNSFLSERVDTVASELDYLEQQAEFFKRRNKINDINYLGNQYLGQSLAYDKEKVDQRGQLKLLDELENYMGRSQDYIDVIPSNNGIQEATLASLIEQYNKSVTDYVRARAISAEKDPLLQRAKEQLPELKRSIEENIRSIKNGYRINLSQLEQKQGTFDNILASLPEKEREYLKLKRQIGVKEQLYLYLLQKKEETQLSLAANINNTRVVDAAFDQGVLLPKTGQVFNVAIFLGLFIPIAIMLIMDFFSNKITERREIEDGASLPILGELSYINRLKSMHRFSGKSIILEQFRLIRTNLQYFNIKHTGSKNILITSFLSGEGKTFVSINLAASLAATGARVLLIELDLRKPKLANLLNVGGEIGLSDFVIKPDLPFSQVIKHQETLRFDVITSGYITPNPAEMLMNERVEEMFRLASENYDYVVMDTSPIGLVADTFLLNKFAHVSIFILRYKYSFKTTLPYLKKLNDENKLTGLGIVVNGIKNNTGFGYGYGYGYAESYGYGYRNGNNYYQEANEERQQPWKRIFKKK